MDFKIKDPGHKDTFGVSPVFSVREEMEFVEWICKLAKSRFPRKKEDILDCVRNFLSENLRQNPFNNNRPGDQDIQQS